MFIDQMEVSSGYGLSGHLIETAADLAKVRSSAIISLVIETDRWRDVTSTEDDAIGFEDGLIRKFQSRDIEEAQRAIRHTEPLVRSIFVDATRSGQMRATEANLVVEHILSAEGDVMPPLISLLRLKAKDGETFTHFLAVSALMATFAQQLGIEEASIKVLATAGLLHDIGKMAVPQSILTKATGLTRGEHEIVRKHPLLGKEILRRFEGLPPQVMNVCLHHHERFDGGGYPHGLRGEAIPFSARLASI